MATHAANNASHTSVCAVLGITRGNDRLNRTLCYHSTINKWAFYSTGAMGVDGNKTLIRTQPSNNYKLGDFRSYNHLAATPKPFTSFSYYYLGTSDQNIVLTSFPYEMNVLACNPNATYITYNGYLTEAYRAAAVGSPASNRYDTYINTANWTIITPPVGHTRSQTNKIHSTHVDTFVGMNVLSLSKPTDYIYMDTYFSDASKNRLVNLGGSVVAGYSTLTMYQQQLPEARSGQCISRGGYTGPHTRVNPVANPSVCTNLNVDQPLSKEYSFYVTVVGIVSGIYNINPTSCTCEIIHYDRDGVIRQTKSLGSGINLQTGSNDGKQIDHAVYGDLANNMAYDDYLKFNVTAVASWGTDYLCT